LYSASLRLCIETSLEVQFQGLLDIKYFDYEKPLKDVNTNNILSLLFSVFFLMLYLIMSAQLFRSVVQQAIPRGVQHEGGSSLLLDKTFFRKYSAFYEHLKTNSKWALAYHVIFIVRRFTIAFVLVFWISEPAFSI
jgi:hypothetical protein